MTICCIHTDFFDDTCTECRKEYAELKGLRNVNNTSGYKLASSKSARNNKMQQEQEHELPKNYKEFTEERAKRLYEDLLVQFLRSEKYSEIEASQKARSIIRKQCLLRHIPFWSWL
jgi:hypothetical protein